MTDAVNPKCAGRLRGKVRTTAEELRRALLPVPLAEAELAATPAAAVLAILRPRDGALDVLIGHRSRREGDPWSGQMGLPGGRRRDDDGSLLGTALRETREEVGLDVDPDLEVLGHMAPRPPANRPAMIVVPFVAYLARDARPGTSSEMEETFWVPLPELPPSRTRTRVLTGLGELTVPAYAWQGRTIWGFTYRLLEELIVLAEIR